MCDRYGPRGGLGLVGRYSEVKSASSVTYSSRPPSTTYISPREPRNRTRLALQKVSTKISFETSQIAHRYRFVKSADLIHYQAGVTLSLHTSPTLRGQHSTEHMTHEASTTHTCNKYEIHTQIRKILPSSSSILSPQPLNF